MTEAERFWSAFRFRGGHVHQEREELASAAPSTRFSHWPRWGFSRIVTALLLLFALYTIIASYFLDLSPDSEHIEVAEEKVITKPSVLYQRDMPEDLGLYKAPAPDILREHDSHLSGGELRRMLDNERPRRGATARREQEPVLEMAAPAPAKQEALGLARKPGAGVIRELQVRLISFIEIEDKSTVSQLSDILPILERSYDWQSYRMETAICLRPKPGSRLDIGSGFTLVVEDIDEAEISLQLRGWQAEVEGDKKILRKKLRLPLVRPFIIGPFQSRTGDEYLLVLSQNE